MLRDHARWANAAYLLGYSAECGLKAVMKATGRMSVDADGMPERQYRKHIQQLWPAFEGLVYDWKGVRYALPADSPFDDWSHHDRYGDCRHISEGVVDRYRDAAQAVVRIVQLATTDGEL